MSITAARSKQLEKKDKGKGKAEDEPGVSASVDTVLMQQPVTLHAVAISQEKERAGRKGFKANVNRLASWFRVLQPSSSRK